MFLFDLLLVSIEDITVCRKYYSCLLTIIKSYNFLFLYFQMYNFNSRTVLPITIVMATDVDMTITCHSGGNEIFGLKIS